MRVFIGEFICGGGMRRRSSDEIDPSMQAEGGAMLSAIAEDLAKFADLSIAADPRICPSIPNATNHEMDIKLGLWGQWVRAAQGCDAAIVIAPESNGVLAKAVSTLRAANLNVIASSSEFLRAASDKQHTARIFAEAAVPHPETYLASDPRSRSRLESYHRFIVKPRDGCGTQQILVFDDLDRALAATTNGHVLQAFVPGRPISVASIVSPTEIVTLPAVSQDIALENCAYHGGCGPLPDDDQRRAASLARCALAALPSSPRGFVGFDLVLGDEPGTDVVIEVNARLTTSYVGLRHMVSGNLAARLLGLESGPVRCKTNEIAVRWTPSGEVWVNGVAVAHD
jgi:predicted ATP-grasp superfamily ATP-dependent carboligase